MVAAGEALNPEVLRAWEEATGLQIRDGYGQTETGQLTGAPLGERRRGRARWAARSRACELRRRGRRADGRPADRADVLPRLPRRGGDAGRGRRLARGRSPRGRTLAHRRPRAARRGRLALLRGAQRRRDRLRRLPHRAVRGRVGARRPPRRGRGRGRGGARRGARRGRAGRGRAARGLRPPSPELVRELQEHVKRETAPYKYPRIVDFVAELPKTASGKVRRAELRGDES